MGRNTLVVVTIRNQMQDLLCLFVIQYFLFPFYRLEKYMILLDTEPPFAGSYSMVGRVLRINIASIYCSP